MEMHRWDEDTETLASAVVRYAENRIARPQPLDQVQPAGDLGGDRHQAEE